MTSVFKALQYLTLFKWLPKSTLKKNTKYINVSICHYLTHFLWQVRNCAMFPSHFFRRLSISRQLISCLGWLAKYCYVDCCTDGLAVPGKAAVMLQLAANPMLSPAGGQITPSSLWGDHTPPPAYPTLHPSPPFTARVTTDHLLYVAVETMRRTYLPASTLDLAD